MERLVVRVAFFTFVVISIAFEQTQAEQPDASLVVAADQGVADAISPIIGRSQVSVLITDDHDSLESIEARALRFRHAIWFVIGPESNHELLPIPSERFRNHGLGIIRLPAKGRLPKPQLSLPHHLKTALITTPIERP